MDIIFNPPINAENQYIRILVGELHAKGYRVHALDDIFSSFKHFRAIKIVHLNWFENVDDSSFFAAARSFIRKLVVLVIIRVTGKPLIWTMHNRASHEKGLSFFSRILTRLLIRWSYRIIIHARQSEDILASYGKKAVGKAVYLPHPNFIGVYGDVHTDTTSDDHQLRLLFMGMVKPYKNLELLIDVVGTFCDQVQLTIAGKAIDKDYETQIAHKANQAGNVEFIPAFVSDGEVAAMIAKADTLILPYNLSSSLNSGTVILAFSYRKTVICPEIGTILDLGERQQDVFHYRYGTAAEHEYALREQIMRALETKQHNTASLLEMGGRLYDYVRIQYDKQHIGAQLAELYSRLME